MGYINYCNEGAYSVAFNGVHFSSKSFSDYAENVEKTFKTISRECARAVKEGMNSAIEKTYTLAGRKELENLFK